MSSVYSTTQAAEQMQVDTSLIRRLAAKHEIGTKLNPRMWIFTEADMEALRAHRFGRVRNSSNQAEGE